MLILVSGFFILTIFVPHLISEMHSSGQGMGTWLSGIARLSEFAVINGFDLFFILAAGLITTLIWRVRTL